MDKTLTLNYRFRIKRIAPHIIGIHFLGLNFVALISCTEKLKSDETRIEEVITDFYEWYSLEIKARNTSSFQPIFVADSNGLSTLDFAQMDANLAAVGFHKNYIPNLKRDFEPCLANLNSIPFDSLKLFEDLDDFDDINCAFSNLYQWTGDTEPHDGVEVGEVTKNGDSIAVAECRIFNVGENMRLYWEHKYLVIKLKEADEDWKISNIEIVFP